MAIQHIIGGVMGLAGIGTAYYAYRTFQKQQLLSSTPRVGAGTNPSGLVQVQGTVEGEPLLKTPFSSQPCVYYAYRIQEYQERKSTDSNGRTRTTHSWNTIHSGKRFAPFAVKDETGSISIQPDGADFITTVRQAFEQRRDLLGAVQGITQALKNWDEMGVEDIRKLGLQPIGTNMMRLGRAIPGTRRFYEEFIVPGDKLFVLGTASNGRIARGEGNFIISTTDQKAVGRSLGVRMAIAIVAAIMLLGLGGFFLFVT